MQNSCIWWLHEEDNEAKQHSVKHGKTNDVQQQVQQSQGEEMNIAKANREGGGWHRAFNDENFTVEMAPVEKNHH